MSKEAKKVVLTEKTLPEPIEVYMETFVYPEGHELEGQEYEVPVKVYEAEVNPNEFLNPAFAYGGK